MNDLRLHDVLQEFVGRRCWRVSAGVSTGSRVNFDFGKQIYWPTIAGRKKRSYGEFGLQIGSAQWRLALRNAVLSSSQDDLETDSPGMLGLQSIVDETIESIGVSESSYDLVMKFANGVELVVFCNDVGETADNYTISFQNEYFSIECHHRAIEVTYEDNSAQE